MKEKLKRLDLPIWCQLNSEGEFFPVFVQRFKCPTCGKNFLVLCVKDEEGIGWVVNPETDTLIFDNEEVHL